MYDSYFFFGKINPFTLIKNSAIIKINIKICAQTDINMLLLCSFDRL
jgi:hypothetical protein